MCPTFGVQFNEDYRVSDDLLVIREIDDLVMYNCFGDLIRHAFACSLVLADKLMAFWEKRSFSDGLVSHDVVFSYHLSAEPTCSAAPAWMASWHTAEKL